MTFNLSPREDDVATPTFDAQANDGSEESDATEAEAGSIIYYAGGIDEDGVPLFI